MRFIKYSVFIFCFLLSSNVLSNDEASNWLKKEIDIILKAYQNIDLPNENKFLLIEQTINNNFAGAGIGKFVAGKSWSNANKETKKKYISLFKRHLALNIASMMQGYSNQTYLLKNSRYIEKNQVNLIEMEIKSDTNTIVVTWRIKKSKDRYFVIDLVIADISLVETKRSEFNSMLKSVEYNLESFNKILEEQNKISYKKIIS